MKKIKNSQPQTKFTGSYQKKKKKECTFINPNLFFWFARCLTYCEWLSCTMPGNCTMEIKVDTVNYLKLHILFLIISNIFTDQSFTLHDDIAFKSDHRPKWIKNYHSSLNVFHTLLVYIDKGCPFCDMIYVFCD